MTCARSDGSFDLVLLPLESGQDDSRNTRVLIEDARYGSVSPDDRLLLYQSEVSGKWEWYVRTISRDGNLGRELQLTTDGGRVGWRKPILGNGSWELNHFYKGSVYRITITLDSVLRETGRELIGESNRDLLAGGQMPDGRFLAIARGDDEVEEPTSVTMVLNWVTELSRGLATSGK